MSQIIGFSVATSSLGQVLVACTDRGLCAVLFGDTPAEVIAGLHARFPDASLVEQLTPFLSKVLEIIETPGDLDVPLDVRGTDLERRIWDELRRIPIGSTATYGEIAARVGAPRGAKDVGDACAANPLAVVVPCHRVIRSNGALAGYRWGVRRKRALLAREARR